ncbi:YjbR protein [Actinosynnema pretiosum]|nr:YjbR protein [Actinosynnema pretiosum]
MVAVSSEGFFSLVRRLAEVKRLDRREYSAFEVKGVKFAYHWPRTETVGLKQLLSEQLALVAERPDVFEPQYAIAGFGWVVVHLDGVEADELAELLYEAWRLSAPEQLVEEEPDWALAPPVLG